MLLDYTLLLKYSGKDITYKASAYVEYLPLYCLFQ